MALHARGDPEWFQICLPRPGTEKVSVLTDAENLSGNEACEEGSGGSGMAPLQSDLLRPLPQDFSLIS